MDAAIASARAIASDRQLLLFDRIPPKLPLVRVNPLALREVVDNLIDNALKYNDKESVVMATDRRNMT